MAPDRGGRDEAADVSSLPAPPALGKRQRALSLRTEDPPPSPASSKRKPRTPKSSDVRSKRSRRESSSASSWSESEAGSGGPRIEASSAFPSDDPISASPEDACLTPALPGPTAATNTTATRVARTSALRPSSSDQAPAPPSHHHVDGRRKPQSVSRSFTAQPGYLRHRSLSSSEDDVPLPTPPSRGLHRERARSLHAPATPVHAQHPTGLGVTLTEQAVGAGSPSLSPRLAPATAPASARRQPSLGAGPRPASPSARSSATINHEARRSSVRDARLVKKQRQPSASPAPAPLLSEMVLPTSMTYDSLADVAANAQALAADGTAGPPTPSAREPTLRELIESVPLDQALSLYQTVNRGTQRALHEPNGLPNGVRAMSPLSQVQSGESGATGGTSSQKGLLAGPHEQQPAAERDSSPDKDKRDRRKSLGLHFGRAKRPQKEKERPLSVPMPALTPSLSTDRALRTPGERLLDELVARAHLHTTPFTFARANECRNYLEARYNPVFASIDAEKRPPNLIDVSRWRRRVREEQINAHGMMGSDVRRTSHPTPLIAGKTLVHRNKRTHDFEIYPDEVLAYIEAEKVPKTPVMPSPSTTHSSPRRTSTVSQDSDQLRPLPRRDSGLSSVYPSARGSERGSLVSLAATRNRQRSTSLSSTLGLPFAPNGSHLSGESPPPSPSQTSRSLYGSPKSPPPATVSRIGSVKAGLARTFRGRESTGHGYRSSGSELPMSPYMSETDLSEAEVGRLRRPHSKADSMTRRGWRTFRGTESLHRITSGESADGGPSLLGAPLSEADPAAEYESLAPLGESRAPTPLPTLDIDSEEEGHLNDLLNEARRTIVHVSTLAPRVPEKIAVYLEQLASYDVASRGATRLLFKDPVVPPTLPCEVAPEVERASRAERILRPSQQIIEEEEEETGSERGALTADADLNSSASSSDFSTESEPSYELPHCPPTQNVLPLNGVRQGPLRRQSLAVLQPGHSDSIYDASKDTLKRPRRMTVATEHAGSHDEVIRPDPLPAVSRAIQSFEVLLASACKEASGSLSQLEDFHGRVTLATREANEDTAELAGATVELSLLSSLLDAQARDLQKTNELMEWVWRALASALDSLLRLIGISYRLVRIILIPLRVVWAVVHVIWHEIF